MIDAENDESKKIFDAFLEKPLSSARLINTLCDYLDSTVFLSQENQAENERLDNIELQNYMQACPKLLKALKDAKNDGNMESVEKFAQVLKSCYETEKVQAFGLISEQLHQAVESFDIENCQLLLDKFKI